MGSSKASTPSLWPYRRSQTWEGWPDIQGQTRHGEPLNEAVTRIWGKGSKALLGTPPAWGRGSPSLPR